MEGDAVSGPTGLRDGKIYGELELGAEGQERGREVLHGKKN